MSKIKISRSSFDGKLVVDPVGLSSSNFSPRDEDSPSVTPRSFVAPHSSAIELVSRSRTPDIIANSSVVYDKEFKHPVRQKQVNGTDLPRKKTNTVDFKLSYIDNHSRSFENVAIENPLSTSFTKRSSHKSIMNFSRESQHVLKAVADPDGSVKTFDTWAFESVKSPRHTPRKLVDTVSGKQVVTLGKYSIF